MSDTRDRVLDAAERLVQTMGFNWFSYADIASELAIRKASVHHHFATKAELGRAMIARYSESFAAALDAIGRARVDAATKLTRYAKLYETVLRDNRLCLCAVLAAEYGSLPAPMQAEIRRFFDRNEHWLAKVIEEGRQAKTITINGSPIDVARMLLSSLEGAMLVARPYGDAKRFAAAAALVVSGLRTVGKST
ncbi:MAG: TetR/AcrR family transcriptional regulator [Myxococcota bacterium]